MPLPRGWILNLMEGDHTFRVTFFRTSSLMCWRLVPNDWVMFVWKVGRAKTFSLIVVTTDGEVGLHVGAERAEMGRLSRQEAMMAAQTAFSPDPHKWELFSNKFPLFPPSLSHAAEAHQLVRSQSAVNILINVNTLYNRTWTDYNTSVSGSMFCCYCLYPRNEILSLLWFLLEKLFFLLEKFLKYTTQNFLLYQNILALCTLCLETAPRRKRFWKYFRGGAEVIFPGQDIPDLVCQFLICLTFIRLLQ